MSAEDNDTGNYAFINEKYAADVEAEDTQKGGEYAWAKIEHGDCCLDNHTWENCGLKKQADEIERLRYYEKAVKWTLSHIRHSLSDASTYGDSRKSADEINGWVDAFKFFEEAIKMRLDGK